MTLYRYIFSSTLVNSLVNLLIYTYNISLIKIKFPKQFLAKLDNSVRVTYSNSDVHNVTSSSPSDQFYK